MQKRKPPPPQPGNKNAVILKEPEIRQIAYTDFCQHIADGFPLEAWSFSQDGYRCSWQTMMSYIKNDTIGEFNPILKEQAHAQAYKKLYSQGLRLMTGEIRGGSPVVWQTVMRNVNRRFGWDSEQITQDNRSHVERLAQAIRNDPLSQAEGSDRSIQQED